MSDISGKTPYEIRLELLKLAQQYVADNYAQQEYWVEKQVGILEDMMELMKKEAIVQTESFNQNYEKSMSAMQDVMASIPNQETILNAARNFQEFVNLRR